MLTATYLLGVNRNSCGVCNRIRDAPAKFPVNNLAYDKNLLQRPQTNNHFLIHEPNGKQKTALRFENLMRTRGGVGGKK